MQEGMPTPWGVALMVHVLDDGIFWVQTAEHGGLLLEQIHVEALLSPKARTLGTWWHDFLTFEQDDALLVVFYEHPELYPWAEENLIQPLAETYLRATHPDYFNVPVSAVVQNKTQHTSLRSSASVAQSKEAAPI